MFRSYLLVLTLLLVGCVSFSSQGPQRQDPSEPAVGDVVDELAVEKTMFTLYEESEDCLALDVSAPGLQETVERVCFQGEQVVTESDSCGWWTEPAEDPGDCDVTLPQVLFGKVTDPNIGYVCVGRTDGLEHEGGVVIAGARFLETSDGGFILGEKLDHELVYGHLFTEEGVVYGEPPLDAPSGPIDEECEKLAPWGTAGVAQTIEVQLSLGPDLRNDDTVIFLDAGTGEQGFHGDAIDGDEPMVFVFRVPPSSDGLRVEVHEASELVASLFLEWPQPILETLEGDVECGGLVVGLALEDVGQSALTYGDVDC